MYNMAYTTKYTLKSAYCTRYINFLECFCYNYKIVVKVIVSTIMKAGEKMLGGSAVIALTRFIISIAGVVIFYVLISTPRFDTKMTVLFYSCFVVITSGILCIWYIMDWKSCMKMGPLTAYIIFALFAIFMSIDSLFLAIYKLALGFYLLAVFLIGGIEISVIFFNSNIWADIIVRVILIIIMVYFINKYLKEPVKEFSIYVEEELDWFSAAAMILSLVFGIGYILGPGLGHTLFRLFQIGMNLFLTGILQVLIYRLYLHIGKEQEYQKENQLMQMNHRLLERQMEILDESVTSSRRICHDIRHHNTVIAEFAQRGQYTELLQYLKEYEKVTGTGINKYICANTAVNNILSAYTKKAEKENINVTMDVELEREFPIPNIDLVTILSNAFENAIYGCMEVLKHEEKECFINILIKKKKNKLVICFSNTCQIETEIMNGQPKPEFTGGIGVSSIVKTAEKYGGEYDFKNDNGIFIFRLIMNIPQ